MDWVKAKLEWTPKEALAALEQRLREDFGAWESAVGESNAAVVTITTPHSQLLIEGKGYYGRPDQWAGLALADEAGIRIRTNDHTDPEIMSALVDEMGEKRLRFRGKDLELWQASRLILERFLF